MIVLDGSSGACSAAQPMSYITTPDGRTTTLRALFSGMPPKTHHKDPESSEVLAYIREALGCDLDGAIRAFDSMRGRSSKVLIYSRTHATWHGAEWTSEDQKEGERVILRRITKNERRLEETQGEIRRLKRTVENIDETLNKLIEQSSSGPDLSKLQQEVYNLGIELMRLRMDPESGESKFADREKSVESFRNLYSTTDWLSARLDALEARLPASDAGKSGGSTPPN